MILLCKITQVVQEIHYYRHFLDNKHLIVICLVDMLELNSMDKVKF